MAVYKFCPNKVFNMKYDAAIASLFYVTEITDNESFTQRRLL